MGFIPWDFWDIIWDKVSFPSPRFEAKGGKFSSRPTWSHAFSHVVGETQSSEGLSRQSTGNPEVSDKGQMHSFFQKPLCSKAIDYRLACWGCWHITDQGSGASKPILGRSGTSQNFARVPAGRIIIPLKRWFSKVLTTKRLKTYELLKTTIVWGRGGGGLQKDIS